MTDLQQLKAVLFDLPKENMDLLLEVKQEILDLIKGREEFAYIAMAWIAMEAS